MAGEVYEKGGVIFPIGFYLGDGAHGRFGTKCETLR